MSRFGPSRRSIGGFFIYVLGLPHAEAHLVSTGLGPVVDGVGHFVLSPEEVLSVIALALLAGLRGPPAVRAMIWTLPLAWIIGGLAGVWVARDELWSYVPPALLLIALGVCVAVDRPMKGRILVTVGALTGVVLGFLDGIAMSGAGAGTALLHLGGVVLAVGAIVAVPAALVAWLHQSWMRIVFRVAGSWIAATGLLLLGWSLRTKQ